jgi:heme-degrading monooxygenase HmoA
MTETYTNGIWHVKPGHEDDFIAAWKDFVSWGAEQPGSQTFRLVRDLEDPARFMSFAPWDSFETQRAWKETGEFPTRMRRVREHVERFEPSTFSLVATVP